MVTYYRTVGHFVGIHFFIAAFLEDDMKLPLCANSIEWIQYSKTEDGPRTKAKKNQCLWGCKLLYYLWVNSAGMRIREMANRCSSWAARAIEPSSANWWHHEGQEWVSRREGGEAPLWVYKFMLYPWPNIKLCHPCSCLLIYTLLYPPCSSSPSASVHIPSNVSLNG